MLDVQDFIEHTGACDISTASSALTQAEGFVVSILGDLDASEKTEVYDGNGEMTLQLKRYPIVSVAEMKFSDGDPVDSFLYFPKKETGEIRMYYPFPRGYDIVSVKYTAGWTVDTIPNSLKFAIYDIARAYLQAGDSLGSNIKRESIDGASVEWGELDIAKPLEVINSYKKIYV